MIAPDALRVGARVSGLDPSGPVVVLHLDRFGDSAFEVTYRTAEGRVLQRLLFDNDLARIEIVADGRRFAFSASGADFRLALEALRIRLAWLFDPYLAVTTSLIEPLPHQITAVYGEMLPRRPLRFLLADDPGAGKTIMAGLFIKELRIRGDLERCLVVAPGNLVEQWQDELYEKFGLEFDIFSRAEVEVARTGNPFQERDLWIARLDQLARKRLALILALRRTLPVFSLIICVALGFGSFRFTLWHRLGTRDRGCDSKVLDRRARNRRCLLGRSCCSISNGAMRNCPRRAIRPSNRMRLWTSSCSGRRSSGRWLLPMAPRAAGRLRTPSSCSRSSCCQRFTGLWGEALAFQMRDRFPGVRRNSRPYARR